MLTSGRHHDQGRRDAVFGLFHAGKSKPEFSLMLLLVVRSGLVKCHDSPACSAPSTPKGWGNQSRLLPNGKFDAMLEDALSPSTTPNARRCWLHATEIAMADQGIIRCTFR